MFFHLKIILRNLRCGGIYSAINIGGLAIGMAVFILIMSWINHEWSYDRFHANEKQLYKVWNRANFDGSLRCWDWTPPVMGPTLKTDYPEIAAVSRMQKENILFSLEDKKFNVDADWVKTSGVTLIEGRDIDVRTYPTDSTAVLLNESSVKLMNLDHPVGEILRLYGTEWHVVGVVKDFIIHSPYEATKPIVISGSKGALSTIHIKFNGINKMSDHLKKTEQIFSEYNPTYPFEYTFVDDEYARKFESEQRLGLIFTWLASLTVFISCMGMFGLVAYMAENRRKEIGVRKVLGASVTNIILLLSREFFVLVVIALFVALPTAWWALNKWLSGYAYRTEIPLWLFLAVAALTMGIALLTVSFQAIKAAMANPVNSIKN